MQSRPATLKILTLLPDSFRPPPDMSIGVCESGIRVARFSAAEEQKMVCLEFDVQADRGREDFGSSTALAVRCNAPAAIAGVQRGPSGLCCATASSNSALLGWQPCGFPCACLHWSAMAHRLHRSSKAVRARLDGARELPACPVPFQFRAIELAASLRRAMQTSFWRGPQFRFG